MFYFILLWQNCCNVKLSQIINILNNFFIEICDFILRAAVEFLNIFPANSHSSYNLGVSITSLAVIVAFIEFISNNNDLKFKLNYQKRRFALFLGFFSIFLTLVGEFELFNKPFVFEMFGALTMIAAILIYIGLIINPLRKINCKKIKIFQQILQNDLSDSNSDKLKLIKGTISIFDSLLDLSIKNNDVKSIFSTDFTSEIFLRYFSESGYIFDKTIEFYLKKIKDGERGLYHLEIFLRKIFVKSLENEESFLNMFVSEKIYPEALFYFDEVLLNEKNNKIFNVLFKDIRFSGLTNNGQLKYIKLATRYFRLIYQKNNHHSLENGYQKKYDFNDDFIEVLFKEIEDFFESCFEQDQLKKLLNEINGLSWNYRWGINTEDKSEKIRTRAGEFLYNVFYSLISRYKIENEDIFRLEIHELYDKFIEIQENGIENNFAYNIFTDKVKRKIIDDEFGANFKGYFPAIILLYFYIFGFHIFAENRNEVQDRNLHVPILAKLSQAFPRLYEGYKQEFYDAEQLPKGKEELLKNEGRKILNKFLKDNMIYNFEENSLSYYYSGKIHSAKIILDNVRINQKIEIIKL